MARNEYRIVIEPLAEADGGGYLATVPDLPGCMADGETDQDALANVHDAIEAWLDHAAKSGRPIPQPQPLLQHA
jgi:predicted RNase H-like HicB family nuclease